jgi:hypothetical protein
MAAIVRWAESQSIADLAKMLFWCSMMLTFLCEIAAFTIMAAISTNNIQSDTEVWMAVWFFAVTGGVVWIFGRAADVESSIAADVLAALATAAISGPAGAQDRPIVDNTSDKGMHPLPRL